MLQPQKFLGFTARLALAIAYGFLWELMGVLLAGLIVLYGCIIAKARDNSRSKLIPFRSHQTFFSSFQS